jgi:hypothetical protein
MKTGLNAWCTRFFLEEEIDTRQAFKAFEKALKTNLISQEEPWVCIVHVKRRKWCLFGEPNRLFCAVPLPFPGWSDEYKFIPPFKGMEDFPYPSYKWMGEIK